MIQNEYKWDTLDQPLSREYGLDGATVPRRTVSRLRDMVTLLLWSDKDRDALGGGERAIVRHASQHILAWRLKGGERLPFVAGRDWGRPPAWGPRRIRPSARIFPCAELWRRESHFSGAAVHDPHHPQPGRRVGNGAVAELLHWPGARFAIIGGHRDQRDRLADLYPSHAFTFDREDGRGVAGEIRHRARLAAGAKIGSHHGRIDNVVGFQRAVCLLCFAVACERPDKFAVPEIFGNVNPENKLVPSREKVRRLPLIGTAGLHCVACADRRVDLLVPVPIEVPEDHVERSIRVLFPTFIYVCDVQVRRRLLRKRRNDKHGHHAQEMYGTAHCGIAPQVGQPRAV